MMTTASKTTLALGILFLLMGCGGIGVDYYEHHILHPFHAGFSGALALLGALLIDPEHMKAALGVVLDAVKAVLPWKPGGPPVGGGT